MLVKQNERWGFISHTGKTIIPFAYSRWEELRESDIVRLYKEDGSSLTWNYKEDKLID
jgi:hypothetical protein